MARSGNITLSLPPFEGATKRLVLINVAAFFVILLLSVVPLLNLLILAHCQLLPEAVFHGQIWQLLTYGFIDRGIYNLLFSMLTLWMFGSLLEESYGSRFLYELYLTCTVGGALLASALAYVPFLHIDPFLPTTGSYAAVLGLLVALAVRMGDQEIRIWGIFGIEIKYLAIIWILVLVASFFGHTVDLLSVTVQLCGALCGWLFVRVVPRRGLQFAASEQMFGIRNAWTQARRRRAARKFEVYMRKQGRDISLDPDETGRGSSNERRGPRDPNDRRWMN